MVGTVQAAGVAIIVMSPPDTQGNFGFRVPRDAHAPVCALCTALLGLFLPLAFFLHLPCSALALTMDAVLEEVSYYYICNDQENNAGGWRCVPAG